MSGFWTLLTIVAGFLVWLAQRRLEMKMAIFSDAVKALSFFEVDVGDRELQKQHYNMGGKKRLYPFLRDETLALTGRCTGLVNAFFSLESSLPFNNAINTVSLKNGQDGYPIVKGLYSTDERKTIINSLSKELSISFILRKWVSCLISHIRCARPSRS